MKEKLKLSGNFASPTMLQSMAWLSFSVYGGIVPVPSPHSQVRFLAKGIWEGSESLTVSSRFWFFHV